MLTEYDFKKEVETDPLELLGVEQQKLTPGMMDLDEMARLSIAMKRMFFSN